MIRAIRVIGSICLLAFVLDQTLLAKCPVSEGSTVVVRSAVADLQIDTTGREPVVESQTNNSAIQLQETCGKNVIELSSTGADRAAGAVVWRIVVPKTVNFDLLTNAGNISIGDVDGNVILRAGGSVLAGHVKG